MLVTLVFFRFTHQFTDVFQSQKRSMKSTRVGRRVRQRRPAYIPPDDAIAIPPPVAEEIDVTTSPPDEERSVTPTASAQSAVPAEQAISPPPMQPQAQVQSSPNHVVGLDSRNIVSGFSACTATTDAARGGGTIKSFFYCFFFIIVEILLQAVQPAVPVEQSTPPQPMQPAEDCLLYTSPSPRDS